MNGQSAAKLLREIIISYEERSTTMPRKGSRLVEILAETPDIKVYNVFKRTPFNQKISCIYCILTEDKERFYIGSTKNITYRMRKHRAYLRQNKHHSKYMQRCFNKNIELYYFILEVTEDLKDKELYWIRKLNPVFNSCEDTDSVFRDKSFIEKYTIPNSIRLSKAVFAFTLDGKMFKKFKSISDAAKYVKTSRSNVRLSCENQTRTCKGLYFNYIDDFDYIVPEIGTENSQHCLLLQKLTSKPVIRDDGKTYISVSEAERLNGFAHNTLAAYIKNKRRRGEHLYEYIV